MGNKLAQSDQFHTEGSQSPLGVIISRPAVINDLWVIHLLDVHRDVMYFPQGCTELPPRGDGGIKCFPRGNEFRVGPSFIPRGVIHSLGLESSTPVGSFTTPWRQPKAPPTTPHGAPGPGCPLGIPDVPPTRRAVNKSGASGWARLVPFSKTKRTILKRQDYYMAVPMKFTWCDYPPG